MGWWVADLVHNGETVRLISWIFWILASITLHELAHGWAAIWQGDDTPIRLNRMTPNPVVHMGLYSLVIFAVCGIAWGMMPVNPYKFRDRKLGAVYVAAAGPAMNLLIAAFCLVVMAIWLRVGPAGSNLDLNVLIFLRTGLWISLVLAALNLIPIPPLDGSTVLAGFNPGYRRLIDSPNAPMIGMFIFLAVFFMSPIGDLVLFRPVGKLTTTLISAVTPAAGP